VAELVHLKVDVIVVASTPGAVAAKKATSTIPVVFTNVGDPVGAGIVASLARPGGNITGLTHVAVDLSAKSLQLLKEVAPRVTRVAILFTPAHQLQAAMRREAQVAAQSLGVELQPVEVRNPSDFEGAFAKMTRERAGALIVFPEPLTFAHAKRIVDLAARHRLPAIYAFREHVEDGGLMSYGASLRDSYTRAAAYVDKILKGAKPADLPVEQPMRFELVINLNTAKALGLTIPQSVLIRADQVIQ
jgi:putative ABC transport system substrate-binding protein